MSLRRSLGQSTTEADALAVRLAELGVPCRVEVREKLAVIITGAEGATRFGEADVRKRALAAARENGYTHLALELE